MSKLIFHNGRVITMNDDELFAEAVLVDDGKIAAVGSNDEILAMKDDDTEIRDLEGNCLMPSFIDAHSHACGQAMFSECCYLGAPPMGKVTSIDEMIETMKDFIEKNPDIEGPVVGYGYDHTMLKELRHPDKFDLNKISTERPVIIVHFSIHMAVMNDLALEMFGYVKGCKDPEGGVVERIAGTDEPNGMTQEMAARGPVLKIFAKDIQESAKAVARAQKLYASYGHTTWQEGATTPIFFEYCLEAAKQNLLYLDLIAYPFEEFVEEGLSGERFPVMEYRNHLKLGGAKNVQDGGLPGKTCWLTKPYYVVPEGEDPSYSGYPIQKDETVYNFFKKCMEHGWQPLSHALGDAAIDQYLRCYEQALNDTGCTLDIRPVLIHCSVCRQDQLDKMKELGITPSYFHSHVNLFGDFHRDNVLGPDRAEEQLLPIKSAIDRGMMYTMHTDCPVMPPNTMHLVWTAVNRVTRSGKVLGPQERITPLEALKAVTINSAWTYFEEDIKGTLEPGKLADMMILDKSPLDIDPMDIIDIKILETIKEGTTIFELED